MCRMHEVARHFPPGFDVDTYMTIGCLKSTKVTPNISGRQIDESTSVTAWLCTTLQSNLIYIDFVRIETPQVDPTDNKWFQVFNIPDNKWFQVLGRVFS